VPLRAANARTLIEQSIGRGLRLPYGKRTAVAAVDRLNIVAHDKFQEIIDDANRADSPIRLTQLILEAPSTDDNKVSVQVTSTAMRLLGSNAMTGEYNRSSTSALYLGNSTAPLCVSKPDRRVAYVATQVISEYENKPYQVPTNNALLRPEVQREIVAEVTERLKPLQGSLIDDDNQTKTDLPEIIARTTEIIVQQTIEIPRILVVPKGDITTGFYAFTLDVSQLHLQPGNRRSLGKCYALMRNLPWRLKPAQRKLD